MILTLSTQTAEPCCPTWWLYCVGGMCPKPNMHLSTVHPSAGLLGSSHITTHVGSQFVVQRTHGKSEILHLLNVHYYSSFGHMTNNDRSLVLAAFSCCSCLMRWSMRPACRVWMRVSERPEFLAGRITWISSVNLPICCSQVTSP